LYTNDPEQKTPLFLYSIEAESEFYEHPFYFSINDGKSSYSFVLLQKGSKYFLKKELGLEDTRIEQMNGFQFDTLDAWNKQLDNLAKISIDRFILHLEKSHVANLGNYLGAGLEHMMHTSLGIDQGDGTFVTVDFFFPFRSSEQNEVFEALQKLLEEVPVQKSH